MNRQQRKFEERLQAKMDRRLIGSGGVPLIGSAAGQPVSPMLDIKQAEEGPTFRLPVVAVGFMQPDIIAALAQAIAPLVVQAVLEVAAQAQAKGSGNENPSA